MKMLICSILMGICLAWMSGCEKANFVFPEEYNQVAYYTDEIIPDEYQEIYGRWRLVSVSGGFSGDGYEPDINYLEIRKVGIYGIVVNDSLIEYGNIVIDTSDTRNADVLQLRFNPDSQFRQNPYFYHPGFYVDVNQSELNLNSYCCDFYNYHFKRLPNTMREFGVNNLSH